MTAPNLFERAESIARSDAPATEAWRDFVALLVRLGCGRCADLRDVDVCADAASIRSQVLRVLRDEPPPRMDAFSFGLFDCEERKGAEAIGFYVAGVEGFDPEDADSLCDPAWFPEGRFLESRALTAMKTTENAAPSEDARETLAYLGRLGAATILVKAAMRGTTP